jgi:hypothetical protein
LVSWFNGSTVLRVIVKEGLVVGGFADFIGLFIGAMWRKNSIAGLRANWPHIHRPGSAHPCIFRKIGELIGLKS